MIVWIQPHSSFCPQVLPIAFKFQHIKCERNIHQRVILSSYHPKESFLLAAFVWGCKPCRGQGVRREAAGLAAAAPRRLPLSIPGRSTSLAYSDRLIETSHSDQSFRPVIQTLPGHLTLDKRRKSTRLASGRVKDLPSAEFLLCQQSLME